MDDKHKILFWNHEVNDLGYDPNPKKPQIISKNLIEFFNHLTEPKNFDAEPIVESIQISDDFRDLFKDYLK